MLCFHLDLKTLGENTEQTPLAKEVKKDQRAKEGNDKTAKDK